MKYYKVVSLHGNELFSLFRTEREFKTKYKINEFVTSPYKTPLFVFTNLTDCKSFVNDRYPTSNSIHIYECKIDGKITRIRKIAQSSLDIIHFWDVKLKKKKNQVETMQVPKGTVLVDKVKLVKLIFCKEA